jgi:nucleotide-binding universal stress UspA family protein
MADTALRPAFATAQRGGVGVVMVAALDGRAEAHDEVGDELRRRAEIFADVAPVEVDVRDGDPVTVIAATVGDHDDPVVCMATHGRGGLTGALLGSVATEVLRTCATPVLLVGPRCRSAALPAERATMVVSTDGTPEGDAIAAVAASWARQLDLDLCVTEATYPEEAVSEDGRPPDHAGAHTKGDLDRLAGTLGELCGRPVGEEVLYGPDPGQAVAHFAERSLAAFVAMSGHGRSGLAAAVLGSVAMETVRHSPCPVLLVYADHVSAPDAAAGPGPAGGVTG